MRYFLPFLFLFLALQAQGKTTYIPSYANRLILIENGKTAAHTLWFNISPCHSVAKFGFLGRR